MKPQDTAVFPNKVLVRLWSGPHNRHWRTGNNNSCQDCTRCHSRFISVSKASLYL